MSYHDKTREKLIEELETLRQRVVHLERGQGQRSGEKEQAQSLHDQVLLSETAIELMNFPLEGDIYQFIGERLRELGKGRFVIISTFEPEFEQLSVRAVVGWSEHSKTILDILGRNPIGMTLPLGAGAKVGLYTQKLEKVEAGLYGAAMNKIPRGVCRALERAFNLGDFYAMGFVREGKLFGSATLVLERCVELRNPQAVKTFMGMAAVALQRRQTEKALSISEERLREAERIAHLGHYEFDVTSGEAVWSDEAFRIFGIPPDREAPTGEAYWDLVHKDDREEVYDQFQRCVKGQEPLDLTYRIATGNGDTRYVHNLGEAEENPESGEIKMFGTFQDVTERMRANQALRVSEQRYRSLYEDSPIPIFEDDYTAVKAYLDALLGSGVEDFDVYFDDHPEEVARCARLVKVVDVNRAALRLYEADGKEALQKYLDDILEAEAYDGFRKELIGIANGERQVEVECVTHTLKGNKKEIILTWQAARGHEDTLSRCLVSIRDITRRRQAEDMLRRRNCELALLHNASQTLGSSLDLDRVLASVLEEVRRLLDVTLCSVWLVDSSRDELVCRQATGPHRETVRGWRLPTDQGVVGLVVSQGEGFIVSDTRTDERYFTGVDQETGLELLSVLAVPLRFEETVIGVVEMVDVEANRFTLEDMLLGERLAAAAAIAIENARLYERAQQEIAERKRIEDELRESKQFSDRLLDSSLNGMYIYDLILGRNVYLNPQYTEITGYRLKDIEEMSQADFLARFHPEDQSRVAEHMEAIKKATEGDVLEVEYRFLTRENDWIWCLSRDTPFEFDEQGNVQRFIGTFLDITRRKQAEEQLEHYAAELERSNRELEQFGYVISHDLQAPLRATTSYLHLLADRYEGQLGDRANSYIVNAVDSAEHMRKMIRALLDLSRVGTRGEEFALTDVEAVVERTLQSLMPIIEETKAKVTFDPLPSVMADETQLGQVFQNLIANGIKFRREKVQPHVHISAKREGDEWIFSVEDNGIGIDPKHAERIFQIFQRLHTEEDYPGLGMGLALCKRIVERHGGRIWVDLKAVEGSTFIFTIPVRRENNDRY